MTFAYLAILLTSFVLTLLRVSPRTLFIVAAFILIAAGVVLPQLPSLGGAGGRVFHDDFFVEEMGWLIVRSGLVAAVLALMLEGFHRLDLAPRRAGFTASYWLLAIGLCLPTVAERLVSSPRRWSEAEESLEVLGVVWKVGAVISLIGIALFAILAIASVVELLRRKAP